MGSDDPDGLIGVGEEPLEEEPPGSARRGGWRLRENWESLDFERTIRTAGVCGLFFYVVGLFTVNDYLYQIGVTDFAVLRVQFVVTGFLTVICMFVPAYLFVCVIATWNRVLEFARPTWKRPFPRDAEGRFVAGPGPALLEFLAFLVIFGAIVIISPKVELQSPLFKRLPHGGTLLVVAELVLLLMLGHRSRRVNDGVTWFSRRNEMTLFFGAVAFFAFLLFDTFASSIYPNVPSQFGGGKPRPIQIVIAADSVEIANHTIPGIFDAKGVSIQLDLLWETSDYLVVRQRDTPNGSIGQIDRDIVIFIVGEPRDLGLGNPSPKGPVIPHGAPQQPSPAP